jgi:hypothetical protein
MAQTVRPMQKILRMRVLMHVHQQKIWKSSEFRPWRILAHDKKDRSHAGERS